MVRLDYLSALALGIRKRVESWGGKNVIIKNNAVAGRLITFLLYMVIFLVSIFM